MKRNTCGTVLLVALAGVALLNTARADTKNMRIAFSNNYAGNSWRQAMLKSYDIVTKKAVADGIVAAADVFTTADKEVPTQAAQIQNLILQGYNAIVINASSPDALNGAIKQAIDAGIVVVSFDGIVTEPGAWRVVVDFKDYGEQEVEHLAKWVSKGGNLLEIRGLAGTSIDDAIHSGIAEGSKSTRNSRSSTVSRATGIRPRRKRRSQRFCLRSLKLPAWLTRVATATVAPKRSRQPDASCPSSLWEIAKMSWLGGKSRRPRMVIRLGPHRLHPASRHSPSGLLSRFSTAAKISHMTCSCLISRLPRMISRPRFPTLRPAVWPVTNIRRRRPKRRSKLI